MARLFPMMSAETKMRNFTANATWTAPMTTNNLSVLTGKGGAGTPASSGTYIQYWIDQYRIYKTFYNDGTQQTSEESTPVSSTASYQSEPVPGNHCDPYVPYPQPNIGDVAGNQTCYRYEKRGEVVDYYSPPTTGAASTGFGKTFPGGYGGEATPVTYNDVVVVPSTSYSIVVPAGGSVTITYLE